MTIQIWEDIISNGIERARGIDRQEALKEIKSNNVDQVPPHLIVKYNRRTSPALSKILRNNFEGMVRRDRRLAKVFPVSPRPVFKRDTNLRELLTRAKLAPDKRSNNRSASQNRRNELTRCNKGLGRNGCAMCPFSTDYPNEVVKDIYISSSGVSVPIQGKITCKSSGPGGFLYCLTNTKTMKQYVGESGRQRPVERFREHKSDIDYNRVSKCVPKHFVINNSGSEDMKFTPFMAIKNKNPYV